MKSKACNFFVRLINLSVLYLLLIIDTILIKVCAIFIFVVIVVHLSNNIPISHVNVLPHGFILRACTLEGLFEINEIDKNDLLNFINFSISCRITYGIYIFYFLFKFLVFLVCVRFICNFFASIFFR